jgi:hypothetical protein
MQSIHWDFCPFIARSRGRILSSSLLTLTNGLSGWHHRKIFPPNIPMSDPNDCTLSKNGCRRKGFGRTGLQIYSRFAEKSNTGQSRRFERPSATSGLPRSTEIVRPARLVGLVPHNRTSCGCYRVLLFRNNDDFCLETGAPNVSQQFHHIRIANVLVASQKNHAFRIRPRRSDGFDLGFEFGRRDQGVP